MQASRGDTINKEYQARSVMPGPDKSVTGQQADIKNEMMRLARKKRTLRQAEFTNLEELQDLAASVLPRMVCTANLSLAASSITALPENRWHALSLIKRRSGLRSFGNIKMLS